MTGVGGSGSSSGLFSYCGVVGDRGVESLLWAATVKPGRLEHRGLFSAAPK
jgi:hypothetical protein